MYTALQAQVCLSEINGGHLSAAYTITYQSNDPHNGRQGPDTVQAIPACFTTSIRDAQTSGYAGESIARAAPPVQLSLAAEPAPLHPPRALIRARQGQTLRHAVSARSANYATDGKRPALTEHKHPTEHPASAALPLTHLGSCPRNRAQRTCTLREPDPGTKQLITDRHPSALSSALPVSGLPGTRRPFYTQVLKELTVQWPCVEHTDFRIEPDTDPSAQCPPTQRRLQSSPPQNRTETKAKGNGRESVELASQHAQRRSKRERHQHTARTRPCRALDRISSDGQTRCRKQRLRLLPNQGVRPPPRPLALSNRHTPPPIGYHRILHILF
ncbi:hypothetical protein AAFF_G00031710 [Aldrovandia affinis]|uniref:Uncharacterized protein n=1 Tax=Aldrovandia affinis TaxID=143900 RepID=A0AAD7S448_9TELE|nr:hypothetical protein AAFF_G00031710 [Aldrovandia affinis]